MKRYGILLFAFVNAFAFQTVYAQDNTADDEDLVVAVKKKPETKVPDYPTMEIKGICVDAVNKAPLEGIMIRTVKRTVRLPSRYLCLPLHCMCMPHST